MTDEVITIRVPLALIARLPPMDSLIAGREVQPGAVKAMCDLSMVVRRQTEGMDLPTPDVIEDPNWYPGRHGFTNRGAWEAFKRRTFVPGTGGRMEVRKVGVEREDVG